MAEPLTTSAALGTAGIASAQELLSGVMNQRFALQRQHQAQDFSAQQFASRYQTTVADLKKAGLNPMLAYTQGGGSPPSSSAASGGGQIDLQKATSSAQQARIAVQVGEMQIEKQRQEIANLAQDRLEAEARTDLHKTNSTLMLQQAQKISAEINKMDTEINHLKQQIQTNKADESLKRRLAETENRKQELLTSQTARALQEFAIAAPKQKAAGTWSGQAAAEAENIQKIMAPLMDAISGAARARGK